jgi:hypothetical protein
MVRELGIIVYWTDLFDAHQLDVKYECAVAGNTWLSFASVSKMCRNCQTSLSTNRHASNTDVPALYNFTRSKLEAERRTLLVG